MTLRALRPAETVGAGFRTLGVHVREVTERGERDQDPTELAFITLASYPPVLDGHELADQLVPIDGYEVDVACEEQLGGRLRLHLVVGLEVTGPEGGGWRGALIDYEHNGQSYTLHVDTEMLICGTALPNGCPE